MALTFTEEELPKTENQKQRFYAEVISEINGMGGGGVTDHGALTGLADDDHPQYHNDTRGDARYYTKGEIDTLATTKANTSHTHSSTDITNFAEAVDDRVSALLVAGTNITLTYNDGANTLTIDASGGGSGLTYPLVFSAAAWGC